MGLFDIFYQNYDTVLIDLMEVINSETSNISATRFATQKCIDMIANAVAKSEFNVVMKDGTKKKELNYRLNYRPNDNEIATHFWRKVVTKLLSTGECLIVKNGIKYYVAESYTSSEYVMFVNYYRDVEVEANGYKFKFDKTISGDFIFMKYDNSKIRTLLNQVNDSIHKIIAASQTAYILSHTPKFKLAIDGVTTLMDKVTKKPIDTNEYATSIGDLISADGIKVWACPKGLDLEQIKIDSTSDIGDYSKGTTQAYDNVCGAFDIPKAVYYGNITEKSDATNEFITYAVLPVIETINDALSSQILTEKQINDGEHIRINISKFKHVDIVDSASDLDKLRSIGFSFDEILDLCGLPKLNTEFSQMRVVTKNYTSNMEDLKGGEK